MRKFAIKLAVSAGYVIKYGCITHCIFNYAGNLVLCSGPSMEPTIYSNDILLTEHISARLLKFRRGDIVIAKCPYNPEQNICKRIKGLPGDKIDKGYGKSEVVPRGHLWLEGDNCSNSTDSRNYGAVPQGLIKSRAILRIYPFENFKGL